MANVSWNYSVNRTRIQSSNQYHSRIAFATPVCVRTAFFFRMDVGLIQNKMKLAGKPGSVVDSHSSRRAVARKLKQPTRRLSEPHHCLPIWSCSGWRLPRFTVT